MRRRLSCRAVICHLSVPRPRCVRPSDFASEGTGIVGLALCSWLYAQPVGIGMSVPGSKADLGVWLGRLPSPQQRTLKAHIRSYGTSMSALPLTADNHPAAGYARLVPTTEVSAAIRSPRRLGQAATMAR